MKEKLTPSPLFSNEFCSFKPSDWLELENPLYANSYRVKAQGVMLLDELPHK
jgi:hypothetical protein